MTMPESESITKIIHTAQIDDAARAQLFEAALNFRSGQNVISPVGIASTMARREEINAMFNLGGRKYATAQSTPDHLILLNIMAYPIKEEMRVLRGRTRSLLLVDHLIYDEFMELREFNVRHVREYEKKAALLLSLSTTSHALNTTPEQLIFKI